ncbi:MULTISPECIES: hypothetical protein [Nocardiaceae]|uniref:hypothetical protein n=1 Tax=Nocardiaceae TaxID=85025 RepID=UPI0012D2A44A|nr:MULTISPECIES: hypothetical protein [Rhodococcus]
MTAITVVVVGVDHEFNRGGSGNEGLTFDVDGATKVDDIIDIPALFIDLAPCVDAAVE